MSTSSDRPVALGLSQLADAELARRVNETLGAIEAALNAGATPKDSDWLSGAVDPKAFDQLRRGINKRLSELSPAAWLDLSPELRAACIRWWTLLIGVSPPKGSNSKYFQNSDSALLLQWLQSPPDASSPFRFLLPPQSRANDHRTTGSDVCPPLWRAWMRALRETADGGAGLASTWVHELTHDTPDRGGRLWGQGLLSVCLKRCDDPHIYIYAPACLLGGAIAGLMPDELREDIARLERRLAPQAFCRRRLLFDAMRWSHSDEEARFGAERALLETLPEEVSDEYTAAALLLADAWAEGALLPRLRERAPKILPESSPFAGRSMAQTVLHFLAPIHQRRRSVTAPSSDGQGTWEWAATEWASEIRQSESPREVLRRLTNSPQALVQALTGPDAARAELAAGRLEATLGLLLEGTTLERLGKLVGDEARGALQWLRETLEQLQPYVWDGVLGAGLVNAKLRHSPRWFRLLNLLWELRPQSPPNDQWPDDRLRDELLAAQVSAWRRAVAPKSAGSRKGQHDNHHPHHRKGRFKARELQRPHITRLLCVSLSDILIAESGSAGSTALQQAFDPQGAPELMRVEARAESRLQSLAPAWEWALGLRAGHGPDDLENMSGQVSARLTGETSDDASRAWKTWVETRRWIVTSATASPSADSLAAKGRLAVTLDTPPCPHAEIARAMERMGELFAELKASLASPQALQRFRSDRSQPKLQETLVQAVEHTMKRWQAAEALDRDDQRFDEGIACLQELRVNLNLGAGAAKGARSLPAEQVPGLIEGPLRRLERSLRRLPYETCGTVHAVVARSFAHDLVDLLGAQLTGEFHTRREERRAKRKLYLRLGGVLLALALLFPVYQHNRMSRATEQKHEALLEKNLKQAQVANAQAKAANDQVKAANEDKNHWFRIMRRVLDHASMTRLNANGVGSKEQRALQEYGERRGYWADNTSTDCPLDLADSNASATPPAGEVTAATASRCKLTPYYDGKDQALVIGVDDYGSRASSLRYPVRDAKVFAKWLVEQFGFKQSGVTRLGLPGASPATAKNIKAALAKIAQNSTPNSRFVLFFAGHGSVDDQLPDGLLCTAPVRPQETRKFCGGQSERSKSGGEGVDDSEHLSLSELLDGLNKIQSKHVAVILDACYSGFFTLHPAKPPLVGENSKEQMTRLGRLILGTSSWKTPDASPFMQMMKDVIGDPKTPHLQAWHQQEWTMRELLVHVAQRLQRPRSGAPTTVHLALLPFDRGGEMALRPVRAP